MMEAMISFEAFARARGAAALFVFSLCASAVHAQAPESAGAQTPEAQRVRDLEQAVAELRAEVAQLRLSSQQAASEREAQLVALTEELEELRKGGGSAVAWYDRFTLGGYGEFQYNAPTQGSEVVDPSRFVVYLGYRFNDWIRLYSETELEHGFVEDGGPGQGELELEQLYLDLATAEALSWRFGRVLAPLGIINIRHEPTTYYSVERPNVERVIIPSTWWLDGVEAYGDLSPTLKYELLLSTSLNGAGFTSLNGIRGGRQLGIATADDGAISGRLDWYPPLPSDQSLRWGVGLFAGGVNNGGDTPGTLSIYSTDFQYSIDRFEFRGLYAWEHLTNADEISAVTGQGIASDMFGWYLEAGVHVMPEAWRKGLLDRSDAVVFARYEDYDTQFEMPSGVAADPAGDRDDWTFGVAFFPVPNVVFKADYQIFNNATSNDLGGQFNLGFGFTL